MPIINHQFKVDLFQLQHSGDHNALVDSMKRQAANELGARLAEMFPYKRDAEQSFKGELPTMTMNRDHPFTDHWETRFAVITEEQYNELLKLARLNR